MMRHLPQQINLVNSYRADALQTYSSTRSLCSIGRSNALTDQYLQDGNFERARDCQNSSRR
jgi:hypothetical protein